MAFSTQKDFFHVPFMNENVDNKCKKTACVKLKTYESNVDDRSWARDERERSKFLSDLVTCQYSDRASGGEGQERESKIATKEGVSSVSGSAGLKRHVSDVPASRSKPVRGSSSGAYVAGDTLVNQFSGSGGVAGLTVGDSLLECANLHLADYQKMLNMKSSLEKQLDVSNQRLATAKEENQKIKEILTTKLDSNTTKDFHNKIQKLIAAGKLTKNEENEMLQIHQKMENMHKAYDVLQAENYYLKRLIEKLSSRVTMDQINLEPEKSTDVGYLQMQVNMLRKECSLLRSMEDEYHKIKQDSGKKNMTDQDAENIKAIIHERNSLREKCKSFKALEKTVVELEQKYVESDRMNNDMSNNLNTQANCIKDMECEMQKMQKYYEEQLQRACFAEQCLKAQLEDLKDDIVNMKCRAQKADMLQTEVACLRNEVLKRDMALNDYDCQYKQLMGVVNELQAMKLQCLQDNHTQTCKNKTDDLAFFTCATLDEIMKELKNKGCGKGEDDTSDEEFRRLQNELEAMKKERDNMCADALKRLQELEAENVKLLNENTRFGELMKNGEGKMSDMLKKIGNLDDELNKNANELRRSTNELNETKKLVEDISNIQLKNQQLANAVGAINSRDDEKVIDDLRRQLEEEMAKLKKCKLENVDLVKQAEQREIELKSLKELNNKLQTGGEKGKNKKGKSHDHVDQDLSDNYKNKKDADDESNLDKVKSTSDKRYHDQIISESAKPDDFVNRKPVVAKAKSDNQSKRDKDNDKQDKLISGGVNPDDLVNIKPVETKALEVDSVNKYQSNLDDFISVSDKINQDILDSGVVNVHSKPVEARALNDDSVQKSKFKTKTLGATSKTNGHAQVFDEFVHRNVDNLKITFNKGRGFEKELRKILDEFIQECGFCFCRLVNPKNKLYAICHKLYHNGIGTLSFRDLAYLHTKIYAQAEQMLPGCLLDMILSDHKDKVQDLMNVNMGMLAQKCCSCKNELCCNKSEQILKEKVIKLEKDIEIAQEYLESLKTLPLENNSQTDFGDITDNNDGSTYRASSPISKVSSKKFRKLKTHLMKNPGIYL